MTRTIIATATAIFWSATCSFALEAGGSVGGASVGASVGGGSAAAGASAGGASVGAGSAGSGGADGQDAGGDAAGQDASGDNSPATIQRQSAGEDKGRSGVLLPPTLCPRYSCGNESASGGSDPGEVPTIEGTSPQALRACRATVVEAAQSYGLVNVTVASYGQPRALAGGGWAAPVFTRVSYEREGGIEVREAPILCQFDDAGFVSSLEEIAG